jgi:hypothetical protein
MSNLISHHLSRTIQLEEGFEEEGPKKGTLCLMLPNTYYLNVQITCSNGNNYEHVLYYKNFRDCNTLVIIRPSIDFANREHNIVVWDPNGLNDKVKFIYFPRRL